MILSAMSSIAPVNIFVLPYTITFYHIFPALFEVKITFFQIFYGDLSHFSIDKLLKSISSLQHRRNIHCGVRGRVHRGYSRQRASSGQLHRRG